MTKMDEEESILSYFSLCSFNELEAEFSLQELGVSIIDER